MLKIIDRMRRGQGRLEDLKILDEVGDKIGIMPGTTICGLADGAGWPVKNAIRKFRPEFEEYIKSGAEGEGAAGAGGALGVAGSRERPDERERSCDSSMRLRGVPVAGGVRDREPLLLKRAAAPARRPAAAAGCGPAPPRRRRSPPPADVATERALDSQPVAGSVRATVDRDEGMIDLKQIATWLPDTTRPTKAAARDLRRSRTSSTTTPSCIRRSRSGQYVLSDRRPVECAGRRVQHGRRLHAKDAPTSGGVGRAARRPASATCRTAAGIPGSAARLGQVTGSENASMAVVYVNDKPVDIGNEKLNLIQAAEKGGVFIPHYCWHPALTVVASCRMCLVEVGERKPDGTRRHAAQGRARLPDAGQGRHRHRHQQQEGQATPRCRRSKGCCSTIRSTAPSATRPASACCRTTAIGYGKSQSRMIDEKNTPPNKPYIGPNVTLFTDRCIMCSRCVRFTREISGEAELQVINRGDHSEIDIFPGEPLDNKLASNVVDLCPVGALCSKDFLYKQRVWNLKTQKSVCADCSTGCSIHLDGNKNIVYRLRPRDNPQAQGHFMCDDGRLGYHYVNSIERFLRPLARRDGKLIAAPWPEVVADDPARRSRPRPRQDGAGGRRRAVAVPDLRGSVSAGQVPQGAVAERAAGARPGAGRRRGRHLSQGPPRPADPAGEVHDPGGEVSQSHGRRGGAEATSRARSIAFDDVVAVGGDGQGAGALPGGRLPAAAGRLGHRGAGAGAAKGVRWSSVTTCCRRRSATSPITSCRGRRSRRRTARSSTTPAWPRRSTGA